MHSCLDARSYTGSLRGASLHASASHESLHPVGHDLGLQTAAEEADQAVLGDHILHGLDVRHPLRVRLRCRFEESCRSSMSASGVVVVVVVGVSGAGKTVAAATVSKTTAALAPERARTQAPTKQRLPSSLPSISPGVKPASPVNYISIAAPVAAAQHAHQFHPSTHPSRDTWLCL